MIEDNILKSKKNRDVAKTIYMTKIYRKVYYLFIGYYYDRLKM